MAVHSVTVSAPDVGLEDLLGIIALNKGYKLTEMVRLGCTDPPSSRLCCIAAQASLICETQLCAAYML
jgi:hypothetical protein